MAIKSALGSFISLMHGDRASTIDAATQAFSDDFSHFARANNREPLNVAIASLKKSPKDKAISQAINEAYKASGLTVGYIGAKDGKFTAQPDNVQATFNDAIKAASEAFKLSLESSEAFAEKPTKTAEEKAKAKAGKEAKATEATEALITAKVQAGELVRSSDVRPFPQEELDVLKALVERLQAENATLQAENATLQAENAAMQITNVNLTNTVKSMQYEADTLHALTFDASLAAATAKSKKQKTTVTA